MSYEHVQDIESTQEDDADRLKREIVGPLPAFIESFNPKTKTCSCSIPLVEYRMADSGERKEVRWSKLDDIPCWFPGGGPVHITWPMKKGTPILLIPCSRSFTEWMFSDGQEPIAPEDYRAYPKGHFFALGRLYPEKVKGGQANDKDLILENEDGPTEVRICANGEVRIKAKKVRLGSLEADKALALAEKVHSALSSMAGKIDGLITAAAAAVSAGGLWLTPPPAPVGTVPSVDSETVKTNG